MSDSDTPGSDDLGLDLAAAGLRADAGEAPALVEGFASWLEDAVPQLTEVDRRRAGVFDSRRHVARIRCSVGEWAYLLEREKSGIVTRRARTVRGITLKTETLPLSDWLQALSAELVERAEADARAVAALRDLLI